MSFHEKPGRSVGRKKEIVGRVGKEDGRGAEK